MTKLKTPLLSFRADGSLGKAITFSRVKGATIAKSIPSHADANTYPQRLQRWRFIDAIFYWRSLSSVAREAYKVAARPLDMTGWAYFLSQYLPSPPDQVLWLPLDNIPGGSALDRSPQGNNGTVFGAVPQTDLIDRCIDVDGIDDRVSVPTDPSLVFTTAMTAMCWLVPFHIDTGLVQESLITQRVAGTGWQFIIWEGRLVFTFTKAAVWQISNSGATVLTAAKPQHAAITFDNTTVLLYLNGLLDSTTVLPGPIDTVAFPTQIATFEDIQDSLKGRQDEPRLYNRCLSPEHIYAIAHGQYYPERLI